jgi:ubiquinone/menaquinone biosynthesis C-methylase UbiE
MVSIKLKMNISNPLHLQTFNTALDLGSGDSTFAKKLHIKNMYLIDKSFKKISKNPMKMDSHSLCINAEAESLPFKSYSIDIVLCKKVLHHLKSLKNVKDEILRILKNKGYFFLIDITVDDEDAYYNCASYLRNKDHIRYYRVNEILDFFKEDFRLILYYYNKEEIFFSEWLKNCDKNVKTEIESSFSNMPFKIKRAIEFKIQRNNCLSFFRKEGYFLFQRVK